MIGIFQSVYHDYYTNKNTKRHSFIIVTWKIYKILRIWMSYSTNMNDKSNVYIL